MRLLHTILAVIMLLPLPSRAFADDSDRAADALIVTAVEKYNNRDFNGAITLLKSITAKYPDSDAAHYYLGLSYFCIDKSDEGIDHLRKAIELDPQNYWYRYRLAMIYMATERPELTITMLESLLEDFPKKSELYYTLIELYLNDNQMDKALETLTQIETVFGPSEEVAFTRFDILRSQGKTQEAIEALETFSEENSSERVLSILGDWYMSNYNDSLALNYYNQALYIDSEYPMALLGKAEVYRMTRRYDDYFTQVHKFIRSSSSTTRMKMDYLQSVYMHSDGQFARSFQGELDSLMNESLSLYPTDSTVLTVSGIYYYMSDRGEKTKELFKKNMDLYPESPSAASQYVEILMYMNQWEELSSEGRAVYGKFPKETSFLQMASVGDYNLGRYDDVLSLCDTILSVCAGDTAQMVLTYSTIGDMYHKLGERKKSYKAYEKALKYDPEYVSVLNNYAYYLSLEGKKLKKAAAMSKITIEKEPDNPTYLDTYGWILHLQGKSAEAKTYFKHAMLYGGKDSVVMLDHYAEVLYALGEYDLAFVYWMQAQGRNNGDIEGLDEKIKQRKAAAGK